MLAQLLHIVECLIGSKIIEQLYETCLTEDVISLSELENSQCLEEPTMLPYRSCMFFSTFTSNP